MSTRLTPGDYDRWARWFLDDRSTRAIAPFASMSMDTYTWARLDEAAPPGLQLLTNALEGIRLAPTNGVAFARLTRRLAEEHPTNTAEALAMLDWSSRRAQALAPEEAEALWARALYHERAGQPQAAFALMERASQRPVKDPYFWLAWAALLDKAERLPEALTAFERASRLAPNPRFIRDPHVRSFVLECFNTLSRLRARPEFRAERLRNLGIPARDPGTPPQLIDLSAFYTEPWAAPPDDPRFRQGRASVGGVEFDARALVQLSDQRIFVLGLDCPERIAGIPVRQKCRRLHFLHFGGVPGTEPTHIGSFIVRFANGQPADLPIIGMEGRLLGPDERPGQPLLSTVVLRREGLYLSTWTNPHPDTVVESIDLISQMTRDVGPCVLGITAE